MTVPSLGNVLTPATIGPIDSLYHGDPLTLPTFGPCLAEVSDPGLSPAEEGVAKHMSHSSTVARLQKWGNTLKENASRGGLPPRPGKAKKEPSPKDQAKLSMYQRVLKEMRLDWELFKSGGSVTKPKDGQWEEAKGPGHSVLYSILHADALHLSGESQLSKGLESLAEQQGGSPKANLVIVDPPYGVGKMPWDEHGWGAQQFEEVVEVSCAP